MFQDINTGIPNVTPGLINHTTANVAPISSSETRAPLISTDTQLDIVINDL